ncbi:MAG: hypothetical protein RI907_169 [Pseudomonadota bacterium]|jgi:type IV pilus assembly protein PilW
MTLVELMVAMTIAMALVAAVSMLFLNTRVSQRSTDERSQMRETGLMALDILGRQIANAGFYPAAAEEQGLPGAAYQSGMPGTYAKAIAAAASDPTERSDALTNGLHGCHSGVPKANLKLSGCDATSTTLGRAGSDGITVAYFTDDAMSDDLGWRADCGRHDIAGDTWINAARANAALDPKILGVAAGSRTAAEGLPPKLPLLGVNQFFLRPVPRAILNDAGQSINAYELACRGIGGQSSGSMYAIGLLPGVEQMVIRYGVANQDRYVNESDATPERYMDANAVTTANAWSRVTMVRVCVMVRNLNAVTRRVSGTQAKNCLGGNVTDTSMVTETFTRTFAIKNRHQNTISAAF